ncbi:hypothetical protein DPMN_010203 [Dreissena polymorpha]|uniref:Uncharacterized protein n=1 Tax=Dreissena polymorpha TaxID=45954 RepID=A0A9D4S1B4_DREPO|nr:hypothetical protein DPMN_010203 [Dreissena polymorpha]
MNMETRAKRKRTQSSAKRTSRRKADQDGFFGVGNENPDADWTGSADHGRTNSLDDEVTPTESEDSEGETRSPSARVCIIH